MPLTVLNVAYPFAPVCPAAVGGAEKILSTLDRALVARGDTSLVAACEGSRPAGRLFASLLPPGDEWSETQLLRCRERFQSAIDRALSAEDVDLVHMHGLDFHAYTIPREIPVLVTLHLPIAWYAAEVWERYGNCAKFACVSRHQRAQCPPELSDCCVVENGVPLVPASVQPREDYAVVMGRICPEKNAHAALEAGSLASVSVLLAGQVYPYPEHRRYFEERIAPLLGSDGCVEHRFLGPVSSECSQRLLATARCLLHPTLAPESSSLVAMEAMSAGTPVIAYRSGALGDIVQDGVTGFIVGGVEEMAEAIGKVHRIPAERCRRMAEERFSEERMLREYFELYEAMAAARIHGGVE